MSRRMRVAKVDNCWAITHEVWRRRDAFLFAQRMTYYGRETLIDAMGIYMEEMEREMSYR